MTKVARCRGDTHVTVNNTATHSFAPWHCGGEPPLWPAALHTSPQTGPCGDTVIGILLGTVLTNSCLNHDAQITLIQNTSYHMVGQQPECNKKQPSVPRTSAGMGWIRTLVLDPGPQVPPVLHVLDVSLFRHTWFKWMVVSRLLHNSVTTHSFESGVLEQGNFKNMQDRGSLRTRVEDLCPNPK